MLEKNFCIVFAFKVLSKCKMMKKIIFLILILPLSLFSQITAAFQVSANNNVFCANDTLHFINQSTNYNTAHWFFGDGTDTWLDNPTHIYLSDGTYTVKLVVYDNNGNADSTSQQITVNPSPTVEIIHNADNNQLTARTTNADSLQWYLNNEPTSVYDSIIYYYESGLYKVVAKNSYGCIDSAKIQISLNANDSSATSDRFSIIVKNNILTPDLQDGANDVLFIENVSNFANPCIVYIYDRNGRLVYRNEDYSNFDGFRGNDLSGKPLPAGTYYYIIKSEGRKTATGYIDIIR